MQKRLIHRTEPCWTWIRPRFRSTANKENSAYNGHFESMCYHPLLLFNRDGDCLAAKLRPGNVHGAEDWEELLLPEIERQQTLGKEVVFSCRRRLRQTGRSMRRWRSGA